MLKQIIIGTEYKKIKYHGLVKHLIFKCNSCGKRFSKMESYCRKQIKIHKNACSFCTPECRNRYFQKKMPIEKSKDRKKAVAQVKKPSFFAWIDKLFTEE